MKKKLLILTVIICLFANTTAAFAQKPTLDEGGFILIDADTGVVLHEYNSNTKMYPASTTKMMTALLALEMGQLDQEMTASKEAVYDIGKDGSNIGIMPGEVMPMGDLLKALMVSSANETANIIAENLCETRQDFVDLMNKKALELGTTNTHFSNPCGAHEADLYTTPADLAKIARYAMTIEGFRELAKMKSYQLAPTNKHSSWPVLYTTNRLMRFDDGEDFKIEGIKTGYTGPAGHNLVSYAIDKNGFALISVVMGQKSYNSQQRVRSFSKELLAYGFNNFERVKLIEKGTVYETVEVKDAKDDPVLNLVTDGDVFYTLPVNVDRSSVKEVLQLNDDISAPVNEGDLIGTIDVQIDGESIGNVRLLAERYVEMKAQAVVKNSLLNFLHSDLFSKVFSGLVILIIAFLLLRFTLRRVSRRVNSRKY